jgi:hypothetical protein
MSAMLKYLSQESTHLNLSVIKFFGRSPKFSLNLEERGVALSMVLFNHRLFTIESVLGDKIELFWGSLISKGHMTMIFVDEYF